MRIGCPGDRDAGCRSAGGKGAPPKTVVMIVPKGMPGQHNRATTAVRSQLADLRVRLHVEQVDRVEDRLSSRVQLARRIARQQKAVAVFWADLSLPDQLFLYLSEPGGGRILVRNISSKSSSREERLETMAVIVRASVKAMLGGARIGIRAPRLSAERKEVEKEVLSGLLRLSVSYGLFTFSREKPLSHGARFELSVRVWRWLRLFLGYRLEAPISVQNDAVTMGLNRHPMEAGAVLHWRLGRWWLEGGGGVVVDYSTWSVTPRREGVYPVLPQSRWDVGLFPFVSGGWSPARFSFIFIALGLDVGLKDTRFVVETASSQLLLAAPPAGAALVSRRGFVLLLLKAGTVDYVEADTKGGRTAAGRSL